MQDVLQHGSQTGCTRAELHLRPWSSAPSLHENRPIVNFHIKQMHLHIPGNYNEILHSVGCQAIGVRGSFLLMSSSQQVHTFL